MATAIVVEYDDQGRSQGAHRIETVMYPAVTRQVVSFTTSTATTNAFNDKTTVVGIIADAKAHFAVATTPTATANSEWIPADQWLFFGVSPGSALKIAFYDGSS